MRLLLATDAGVFDWRAGSEPRAVLQAGRVQALARGSPESPVLYAATEARVFRSADGGGHWEETAAHFPGFDGISSLAVHPADDDTVLAGMEPSALFITRDGGREWVEFAAIRAMSEAPGSAWHVPWGPARGHVRTPVFDPDDPNRIYLPIEVGGVVRTDDGGETWENVHGGIHDDVHALALNPLKPAVVYAVTRNGFGRSDDHARTWEALNHGLTKTYCRALAVDPRSGRRLFTAGAPAPPGRWHVSPAGSEVSLFRSEDAGDRWQLLGDGLPAGFHGYVDDIALAPGVPDRVFFCNDDGEIWTSADGGDSWRRKLQTHPTRRLLVLP